MDAYPGRSRARRILKGALAGAAALALSVAGIAVAPQVPGAAAAPSALAGPAAAATTTSYTNTTNTATIFSGTVPAGICTVTATVLGGAGGSAGVASVVNGNGAGASVTVTYPVVPGMAYSGSVGGGGQAPTGNTSTAVAGAGGVNGGATGGTSGEVSNVKHHGAGGGGYSELLLGGTTAVVAGGGGGGGGGHSTTTDGAGGNAGLPTGTGVTAGSDGVKGKDVVAGTTVGGGKGGTTSAAGVGGVNSASSSTNGVAGSGRSGGIGGADPNPDAGGGGGGGYFGGGGGASTNGYNSQSGSSEIAGAGGGGGASYIAASVPLGSGTSTPTGISSSAGARIASGAGAGAGGAVTLVWNSCAYDLAVTKTASPTSVPRNSTVTWTVTVTNNGPSAMTLGDTVTIADTLPGTGAKTIQSISVSGGTNHAILANGTFTCASTAGSAMPASLDCYRPYAIGAAAPVAGQYRGLNVGETLTVTYSQPVPEAGGTTLSNTATVTDRTTGDTNDSATASTTVIVPPVANNDSVTGLALGSTATVSVLTNDTGSIAAGSVKIMNGATPVTSYVVAGQGTWTVSSDVVSFVPLATFKGDPTPITYQITGTNGLTATATVTATYVPAASNDVRTGLTIGSTTTVDVLTNDNGDWNTGTLTLMNGATPVSSLVVAGQGTWTVSGSNIVFTPLASFKGDPTAVTYRITDTTGDPVTATVTLNYVPTAANDSSLGNALGTTVNQSVLTNDNGDWNTATLKFTANNGTTYVVAGQGTWSVQSGGVIRFVPQAGFKGDPTPVTYSITDTTGDAVTATVTVGYVPSATNDSSTGNALGTTVSVPVLTNDDGDWAPGTLTLMNGLTPVTTIVVPGEGTWSVSGTNVVFTPEAGYKLDPTPVHYRVTDTTGDYATATVTVAYVPSAVNDARGGLAIGAVATVPVLANDNGAWNTATLKFTANNGTSYTVAGQGTWTISGTDVVFTPQSGFLLDPTPVSYSITDTTGDTVSATVTLDYGPVAVDDQSLGNTLGATVSLGVLTNDTGSFNVGSLKFAASNGTSYTVAGQGTWTITGSNVAFTPLPAFLGDPTPVVYTVNDVNGDPASATVTIAYVPAAANDSDLDNAYGTDVNLNVLANDHGDWALVRILNGSTPVTSLVVPGQGTWLVEADQSITFHPEAGFLTDPTDITYQATDTTGDKVTAQVHVTYLPEAVDDAQGGLSIGSVATVPVLANDHGDWVVSSLTFTSNGGTTLVVAGQGTWTVSGSNLVFTPQSGFLVDPSPVSYSITDTTGDTVSADVTLNYGPGAADDEDLGNTIGDVVDVHVFDNDSGSFDDASLSFSSASVVTTEVVAGQGTWTVRAGGIIRFTPAPGFLTDPTPVRYYADDVTGDPVDALVTITYVPAAADDSKLDNAFGTNVTVNVLGNDTGDFPAGSVRLLDGTTPTTHLVVPGEGSWTVQPDDTVTFQPAIGFAVDPSPVHYQVTDSTGDVVSAQITVTYLPMAHDDSRTGLTIGAGVTINVLSNDDGSFDTASVRLIDPVTHAVAAGSVTVAGQGVWSLGASGSVVFTPAPGFLTDPSPIDYRVTDVTGDVTGATITLDYVPAAVDDSDLGNVIGSTVDISVWGNDTGDFDITTLGFGAGSGVGTTKVVAGQGTWSVRAGGVIRFVPQAGFKGDPTPQRYYVSDSTGDQVDALITITYVPSATNDSDLGNVLGRDVDVTVLGNDDGDFVAGSVQLKDGASWVTTLVVAGQGTWSVQPGDVVRFHPLASFLTDPTPVQYRVQDTTGDIASATVTITYLPEAADDAQGILAIGSAATVPVLANDTGDFVASSLRFASNNATTLTVPGEGVWTISGTNVVFTPASGFLVDPAPVTYRVTDSTGDTVTATVTLDYGPDAVDDESLGNTIGTTVDLDVLGNDSGSFDLTTLGFGPGNTGVGASLVVPGEGTWTVLAGGVIRFTPLAAFAGDPTVQSYHVDDVTGDATSASMTITYVPLAADDSDLGNTIGDPVNVDVLANDTGAFTAGTVRLLNGATPVSTLVVAGQGTWAVQADDSITFTPQSGFLVDPTVQRYQVTDTTGDVVSAQVTITYLPQAADDSKPGNTMGSTVNVTVLGNDTGSFVLNSVRILDGGTPVLTLTVAGEGQWRANSDGTVTFVPQSGFLVDPAPVSYQVTDATGDTVSAVVTITYLPTVASDVKNGSAIGSPTTLSVLSNDTGDFDPTTLRIIDPGTNLPVTTLVVAGQGTWTTDTSGHITFTPEPGYMGNPTPVTYEITDVTGDTVSALATVTYLPTAANDKSLGNPQGKVVTVSILTNDQGVFDVSTARLVNGSGTPMMNLVVAGQGSWHMNATTGEVTFTPQAGFTGDPSPVPYQVYDTNGNLVSANVTITYLHPTALQLAMTGMSSQTPLMIALAAIILGLGAMIVSRGRRITARHRA